MPPYAISVCSNMAMAVVRLIAHAFRLNLHVGGRTGLAACYRLVGSRSHAVDAALRYKRLFQHGYAVVRLIAHAFRLNLHVGGRTGLAACYQLVGSRSHAALLRMPPYATSVSSNMVILWYAEWSMQCIPAYSSCLRRTKTDTCCWLVCSRPHAVPLRLVCAISHRD